MINLEDLLIYRSYTPKDGWRTQKRPGLDEFLRAILPLYEVVIFSDSYFMVNRNCFSNKFRQWHLF